MCIVVSREYIFFLVICKFLKNTIYLPKYSVRFIYFSSQMAEIKHNNTTFFISDTLQEQYPELIQLVLITESMDDEERQYWFDIMPSMNDTQIDRLFNILETERRKLEELEIKYQQEIKALNEKHLISMQDNRTKEAKQKIAQAEADDVTEDPEEVLRMLNSL